MVIIRTMIFTLLVPGSVTVGVPCLMLSSGLDLFSYESGRFRLIGFIPIALGIAFYIWCAWDFAFAGKGTPAPWDSPGIFVSRGLYRIVRNPMYLGVECILLGEAIAFESLTLFAYALLVWFWFHLFVIYYEEPTLKKKFGATYAAYCNTVPRWMPNLRRPKTN